MTSRLNLFRLNGTKLSINSSEFARFIQKLLSNKRTEKLQNEKLYKLYSTLNIIGR
jgi:hypothetical protein